MKPIHRKGPKGDVCAVPWHRRVTPSSRWSWCSGGSSMDSPRPAGGARPSPSTSGGILGHLSGDWVQPQPEARWGVGIGPAVRPPVHARISSLIASAERGDRPAADELFAALYAELHRLAKRQLARRGKNVTLGTTTLLHKAYLDISSRDTTVFPDEGRFMAYAARVMHGLIIDYARSRQAQKRGGRFEITSLGPDVLDQVADGKELAQIGQAVDDLATVDA